MKKFLLFAIGIVIASLCFAQTPFTATYTFPSTGADGNVASFAYNGTTFDGITMSNIIKAGVTTSSSNNNFRASIWPLGAINGSNDFTGDIDSDKYIGFSISAVSGYRFTITSITFGIGRSGTGIRQSQWRGSADSYAAALSNYTTLNAGLANTSGVLTNPDANTSWTGNVLAPGASYANITTSAGFRLYLFNSEATGGTAGLQGPITIIGEYELASIPALVASPATLSNLDYIFGNGPSASQSFTVSGTNLTNNITVTPPANFEISDDNTTFQTTAISLTPASGTVPSTSLYARLASGLGINSFSGNITVASTGATSQNIALSGNVEGVPIPTITTSTSTLPAFSYAVDNGPSASQSFTVSGSNLTGSITLTPPANFEISTNNTTFQTTAITLAHTAGTVATTTIYTRLVSGLSVNSYTGNIAVASSGAGSQNIACSGNVFAPVNAWINEIHYDNASTDVNEMVEIVIENAGDYNIGDFLLTLYNGANGASYSTTTLSAIHQGTTFNGFTVFTIMTPGMQNGAPDGLSLSWNGSLIQFLSYEGTFTATNGVANGVLSTDIGIDQNGSDPIGISLQLTGAGTKYSDFTWIKAQETPGNINVNQLFGTPPPVVPVSKWAIVALFMVLASGIVIRKRLI